MKAPKWLQRDRPGSKITLELEIRNLKDMERMERSMAKFAKDLEGAADASERLADALERSGLGAEHD